MLRKISDVITSNISKSIAEQEDPKNRIVRKARCEATDTCTYDVIVVSDVDGFAEDEKVLFETIKPIPECHVINISEEAFITKYFGTLLDELLRSLDVLYSKDIKESSTENDDGNRYFKEFPVSDYVEGLCCACLIASNGTCNWENIHILKNHGYDVFAGDKDSFGWLTGCVQKNDDDRILVYG